MDVDSSIFLVEFYMLAPILYRINREEYGGGWRETYNDWLAWFWTTVYSAEYNREL